MSVPRPTCMHTKTHNTYTYTLVWPKKLTVENAWLHKAALVTHKKISLCAKFLYRFRGRALLTLFRSSMLCISESLNFR